MAIHQRFRPAFLLGMLGIFGGMTAGVPATGGEHSPPPVFQMPADPPPPRQQPTHTANHWSKWKNKTAIPKAERPVSTESYSLSPGAPGDYVGAPENLEPVEIIEGGAPFDPRCLPCEGMEYDGGICDMVYRSKGCDRIPCPCPTDEVLSYYRCNFYGHYPTFWRPWPGGFLKYRPEIHETMYDRYRKPQPGQALLPGDLPEERFQPPATGLDRELQDLMRETAPRHSTEQRTPPPLLDPNGRQRPPALPDGADPETREDSQRRISPPPELPDQSNRPGVLRSLGRVFDVRGRSNPQPVQQSAQRPSSRRF